MGSTSVRRNVEVPGTAGLLVIGLLLVPAPLSAQPEVVVSIQVHGNTLTPSEEIIRVSGLVVGDPFSDKLLADAEARLRAAIELDSVDVLKRYASMTDPTKILVVIQVDEGPVRVDIPDVPAEPPVGTPPRPRPAVVRRSRLNLMVVPILTGQDGYGFSYGAQFAISGHGSSRRRLVVPVSWGGDKRAAVEYQQEFQRRFSPRLRSGVMVQRRTHPFFDEDADRTRVWGRAEWPLRRWVHTGTELAWQSSTLVGEHVEAKSVGADVVFDTRVDPVMPYNAIYLRAAAEALRFPTASAVRTQVDANGYLGLVGGAVLALRVLREDFSRPAPAYYKSILGGSENLRGFRAGYAIGDTLVAGSAELRIPLTSPLRSARLGASAFIDAGTTYDDGARFRDQKLQQGIGGGMWVTAPLFRLSLMVARGIGEGTRVHFAVGLTF